MAGRAKTWGIVALVVLAVLGVGVVVGFRLAVAVVKGKVEEALGPESEVKELRVRWNAVEVVGLRSRAPQGWPAAETLRAERVVIVPRLRSLLSDRVQAASVTIVKPTSRPCALGMVSSGSSPGCWSSRPRRRLPPLRPGSCTSGASGWRMAW